MTKIEKYEIFNILVGLGIDGQKTSTGIIKSIIDSSLYATITYHAIKSQELNKELLIIGTKNRTKFFLEICGFSEIEINRALLYAEEIVNQYTSYIKSDFNFILENALNSISINDDYKFMIDDYLES